MRAKKTIRECTPLIPEVVAETVLGKQASKGKIISLVTRAETVFKHNKEWRRKLINRERSNHMLYNYMCHWADAKIWYTEHGTVDYSNL